MLSELIRHSNGAPCSFFWSTSPTINNLFDSSLKSSKISSIEVDKNRDQKADRLELNIVVPLDTGESIAAMSAIVFFDVALHDKAKYKFDTLVFASHESTFSMQHLLMDGELTLAQRWALPSKGSYRTPYAGDELLSISKLTTANDVAFTTLLQKNADRNCTYLASCIV